MKKIFLLALLIGSVTSAEAQYRSGGGSSDKWYFGGGFGLSIGTNYTSISASPMIGYKITDPFSVGTSVIYQYVSANTFYGKATLSNYGLAPFTRFQITDQYFAHAEYEYLNYEFVTGLNPDASLATERDGYSSLWLGGGYRENIGRNAGFFMLALYNVLYDPLAPGPYASPLSIRAGFAVGF